jgi:hypothetical protein
MQIKEFGLEGQRMDKGWVETKVQSWHLHCCILCQMVLTKHLKEVHDLVTKKG